MHLLNLRLICGGYSIAKRWPKCRIAAVHADLGMIAAELPDILVRNTDSTAGQGMPPPTECG